MNTTMARWLAVISILGAGCSGNKSSGAVRDAGGNGGGSTAWLAPPAVAPALVVPAGATPKIHDHAEGAQIYTCTATAGADGGATTYAWVLKAPDAILYDAGGAQVGTHGAGPHWTASDGSTANGMKVAEQPSPSSDAISWLLLRVASTSGTGVFSDVSYVQRVGTNGGKAPADGCDATTVGTDTRAPYTGEYYFFTGGAGAAWLTPPADLPDAIAAPTNATLKVHDHAIGVQIYACLAGADPTTYAWVLQAPDAVLYDESFVPVATHGAGPSWMAADGSALTGGKVGEAAAPSPGAIPWLLLQALSSTGTGELGDIAFVQRVNTAGGEAPTGGCDATTANTNTRVPYSADYYFYTAATGSTVGGGASGY